MRSRNTLLHLEGFLFRYLQLETLVDIDQIRQFVAAAENRTFYDAAKECHVSQSTLTRSIQRVEADMGTRLFDRVGRRVSLNEAGAAILPHARRLVEQAELMRLKADEVKRGGESISVASCAPAPLWRLVPMLSAQPNGRSITSRTGLCAAELEIGVLASEFNLAILPEMPKTRELKGIHLMRETLSVSLPCDHRLARREALSFSDLDGETFIIQTGVGYWEEVVRRKLPRSPFVSGGDYITTANMMSTSPLAHFATDYSMESVRASDGHVLIPLVDAAATADFWLVWRRDQARALGPLIAAARQLFGVPEHEGKR